MTRVFSPLLIISVALLLCSVTLPAQSFCIYSAIGTGVPGGFPYVSALRSFDDGTGQALYAGGSFITMDGVAANRIAKWDGATWAPLGAGTNNLVNSITEFNDPAGRALYVGGIFTMAGGASANRVARWDGTSWSPLGSGTNNAVNAMAVFDDGTGPALYLGGTFTMAGGAPANRVAKWDGVSFTPLGMGLGGPVTCLEVFDDGTGPALFAGGSFTTAGGIAASNIAKWDGTTWSPLGTGTNSGPYTMQVYDDGLGAGPNLIVAGYIFSAGGVAGTTNIARWDGTNWFALLNGADASVACLEVMDDLTGPKLYVGGTFTAPSLVPANRIATWDGIQWNPLLGGLDDAARSMTIHNGPFGPSLYVGGQFLTADGITCNGIAQISCLAVIGNHITQVGGPGGPVWVNNFGLTPGHEYYNVFSTTLCPTQGGGPYLGLCATNPLDLLALVYLPIGTSPVHFIAGDSYVNHGPFLVPPVTIDMVTFEIIGGAVGAVSPVNRFMAQ